MSATRTYFHTFPAGLFFFFFSFAPSATAAAGGSFLSALLLRHWARPSRPLLLAFFFPASDHLGLSFFLLLVRFPSVQRSLFFGSLLFRHTFFPSPSSFLYSFARRASRRFSSKAGDGGERLLLASGAQPNARACALKKERKAQTPSGPLSCARRRGSAFVATPSRGRCAHPALPLHRRSGKRWAPGPV